MLEHPDRLKDILLRQLRGAVGSRIADGTDPDAVTADLTERLRRLRRMRPATELERRRAPGGKARPDRGGSPRD